MPLLIQHLTVSVAASRGKRCGSSSKPAPLSLRAVDNPADLSIATLYMQCNKKVALRYMVPPPKQIHFENAPFERRVSSSGCRKASAIPTAPHRVWAR
jgi:hypothetical protein